MNKIKKLFSRYVFPVIFKAFPLKEDRIVFSSFGGRNYSGNPRVISETIGNQNLNYKCIWLLKKEVQVNDLPNNVKRVDTDSLLSTYYLYTSKFWIDDSRKTIVYRKRKKQIYFQTWHGTPLKKIEFDAEDKLSSHYLKYAKKDSESITYLLSGNRYSSEKYLSAFRISKNQLVEIGTPRNDKLVSEANVQKSDYLDKNEITILFAPTFRNNMDDNGVSQLEKLEINLLKEFFALRDQKLNFMTKFHPNVNQRLANDKKSREYMKKHEVELVDDGIPLENLFENVDVLITDYSSIFFDYALLKKPLILFNYDEYSYSKERGFYIELGSLPVPVAQNGKMLIQIFEEQAQDLLNSSERLLNYVGNFEDGTSTEKVIELMKKASK